MEYSVRELSYPSADGVHTIFAKIFAPIGKTPIGIVQLVHGMIDHVDRYKVMAAAFCEAGYILAGNCHLGHGKSAGREEDYGFFSEEGGTDLVLKDLRRMNRTLCAEYPGLPIVMLGHSMGSFLARLYVEKYPGDAAGLIIHGTGGPNPAAPIAKLLIGCVRTFKGPRYHSTFLEQVMNGAFNKKCDKAEGKRAWLTRDQSTIAEDIDHPFTNFSFTTAAYRDLVGMLVDCNRKSWFEKYTKNLPTLVVSGDADPVGNYGKGPKYVYTHLLMAGCDRVELILYPGARHELFNETNRADVFSDLLSWIGRAIG